MKLSTVLNFLFSFILAFFIFFGYLTTNSYPVLYSAICVGAVLIITEKGKLKFKLNILLWLFLGVLLLISSFFSLAYLNAMNFSLSFLLLCCLGFICSNIKSQKWFKFFVLFSLLFGLIHVASTLLYESVPELIQPICQNILKPADYVLNVYLYKYGGNPGITGQTGINGWFISVTLGLLFMLFFDKDKKKGLAKNIIFIILILMSMIALILTSKRSFILFCVIALLVILFSNNRKSGTKIKTILPIAAFAIIMFVLISNNSEMSSIFYRFVDDKNDISSGRFSFYEFMVEQFWNTPLFGCGTMSLLSLMGNMGHNIYLQILCENGIIIFGFFMFVIANTIYMIKKGREKSTNYLINICYYIFLVFMLYGITGNPLYTIQNYGMLLIAIGFMNNVFMKGE